MVDKMNEEQLWKQLAGIVSQKLEITPGQPIQSAFNPNVAEILIVGCDALAGVFPQLYDIIEADTKGAVVSFAWMAFALGYIYGKEKETVDDILKRYQALNAGK